MKSEDDAISFQEVTSIPKEYLIVYNSKKNPRTRIGPISQHMESVSIRFSMEKYQGTFFQKVLTISKDVFQDKVLIDM